MLGLLCCGKELGFRTDKPLPMNAARDREDDS